MGDASLGAKTHSNADTHERIEQQNVMFLFYFMGRGGYCVMDV